MKDKSYKVIIIDDEPTCITQLYCSLQKIKQIKVVGTAEKAVTGKNLVLKEKPDLIFLDMEMPESTGLDFLHKIKEYINWNMYVIFYTAYSKYLLNAIRESSVFDFLLKPYTEDELQKTITRFLNNMKTQNNTETFKDNITYLLSKDSHFLFITTIRGYRKINISDIGYFTYNKNTRFWHLRLRNESIKLKRGISAANILQFSSDFVQISQRQIINITHLASIENKICIMFPPFDKTDELKISRTYLSVAEDQFFVI